MEHRLEFVATVRGVDYYNDSKATNVDATMKAIASFPGRHSPDPGRQGQELRLHARCVPLLHERVKAVYTIGAAAEKIEAHIAGAVDVVHAEHARGGSRPGASRLRSW